MSDDAKEHLSKVRTGMKFTDEHKANISKSKSGNNHPNYGKHLKKETIAKIKASNLVVRDQAVERTKRMWQDPEYRNRLTELYRTKEFRANASAKAIERFKDPCARADRSKQMVAMWQNPVYRERLSGENANAWRGGITRNFYRSAGYRYVRRQIINRDFFVCRVCFDQAEDLEVHHIKPLSKYPEMGLEFSNLITLCAECHAETVGKEWAYESFLQNILART